MVWLFSDTVLTTGKPVCQRACSSVASVWDTSVASGQYRCAFATICNSKGGSRWETGSLSRYRVIAETS